MATKSWQFEIDGKDHEVVLEWGYWGGKRVLSVDGTEVDSSTIPMRFRSTQEFDVDGHQGVVKTRPAGKISAHFILSLEVDGREIESKDDPTYWEQDGDPGDDNDDGAIAAAAAG